MWRFQIDANQISYIVLRHENRRCPWWKEWGTAESQKPHADEGAPQSIDTSKSSDHSKVLVNFLHATGDGKYWLCPFICSKVRPQACDSIYDISNSLSKQPSLVLETEHVDLVPCENNTTLSWTHTNHVVKPSPHVDADIYQLRSRDPCLGSARRTTDTTLDNKFRKCLVWSAFP